MSHHSFTFFFTRPAYRLGRCAMVPVMPAASPCNLRDPGWEDPGFRHGDFFALAPNGPSGDFCGFFLALSYGWPARYLAPSCLVTPLFTAARYDVYIPLIASPFFRTLGTPAQQYVPPPIQPWRREPWKNRNARCAKIRLLPSCNKCKRADRPSYRRM